MMSIALIKCKDSSLGACDEDPAGTHVPDVSMEDDLISLQIAIISGYLLVRVRGVGISTVLKVRVCMYVCLYACMHVYMYVYIYTHTYVSFLGFSASRSRRCYCKYYAIY